MLCISVVIIFFGEYLAVFLPPEKLQVDMMKVYDEAKQRQSLILFSQVCKCAKDWPGMIVEY